MTLSFAFSFFFFSYPASIYFAVLLYSNGYAFSRPLSFIRRLTDKHAKRTFYIWKFINKNWIKRFHILKFEVGFLSKKKVFRSTAKRCKVSYKWTKFRQIWRHLFFNMFKIFESWCLIFFQIKIYLLRGRSKK